MKSVALKEGWMKIDVINTVFVAVCVMEIAAVFVIYFIKRAKS